MGNIRQINIKNRTYCFFNDMIKKSYKHNCIYNIGCITIKSISDCENINIVNSLYLIIGEVDGYIEENNGNKYLTFASTVKKNKNVLEKYASP